MKFEQDNYQAMGCGL